jgi:TolB-like protein/DNA-binding winged helix-turn-helix (wHTH) protein
VTADLRLGPWRVEPGLNRISCSGSSLRLEPKVMEVLVCLAHHAGETLSKEHLLQAVWAGTFVSDDVLTRSVSELRRVLEDDPKEPKYIQTVPKRGYRMVAPVEVINDGSTPDSVAVVNSGQTQKAVAIAPYRWMRSLAVAGVTVLLLALLAAFNPGNVRARFWAAGSDPQIRSLAVLPLKNLSGDPSQEYFADGMTDELITYLSQNHDLRVISYTSSLVYKSSKEPAPEIARKLGVDALVEGSVQRVGGRVRVNAQLIYAPRDAHLWAQSYSRDLQEALTLQSELAANISAQVNAKLTAAQQAHLQAAHPVNLKALEAYLQGNAHLARVGNRAASEEGLKAIVDFREAIREDPTFAAAYLKICQVYDDPAVLFSKAERWPAEREAAEKAISLDPNLAGAHVALGWVRMDYDRDLSAASAEFQRAIELDPNSVTAHDAMGDYLEITNRLQQGRREHELAQRLDPGGDHLTPSLFRNREYDRGIEFLKKRIETRSADGGAHYALSNLYAQKGMQPEYVSEFQKTAQSYGYPDAAVSVGHAFATVGYLAAQREVARQMELYYRKGELDRPVQIAVAYARLGDKGQSLRWLEQAYKGYDQDLMGIFPEPEFDFLHSDSRFKDLMRRLGLPTL